MTSVDANMLIVLIDHRAPLELWLSPKPDKWARTELYSWTDVRASDMYWLFE